MVPTNCDVLVRLSLLTIVVISQLLHNSSVDAFPCPTNSQFRSTTDRMRRLQTNYLIDYPSLISNYQTSFHQAKGWRSNIIILSSMKDDNDDGTQNNDIDNSNEDEEEEEIILRMNLSVLDSNSSESTMEKIIKYIQSFPFSAVLPVQPLTYVPSDDNRGVKVTFLRKKTKEKGSVDGGIDISATLRDTDDDNTKIQIEAKRNSEGQTVSKVFSEMLIVKAFIKGLSGEEDTYRTNTELSELISIDSIFHKWM